LLKFCPELPEFALSPLSAAVSRSHASCVKILLKNAPMLIHNSSNGFTPLMRAVSRGDIHIVKLLLWAGADVEELSYLSTDDGAQSETVTVQQMMKLRCQLEDKQKSDALEDVFKRRRDCKDLSAFREQFPNLIPGLI
jgi:ankyrin repeat protein